MSIAAEGTLQHALMLAQLLQYCDYSCVILLVLYELGVQPKNDGFVFLKYAIAMHFENPMQTLQNDIYPAVGNIHGGRMDGGQVEQAIRRTIRDAWKNRDDTQWCLYFPTEKNGTIKKPSNAEFIARIAWFVELWQGCCKGVAYAGK